MRTRATAFELSEFAPGSIRGVRRRLAKNEFLFLRDQAADWLFQVESGRLCLERSLDDGALVCLAVLHPQDLIAEAALFSEHYHCDARAEVRSTVWGFSKREVLAHLKSDSETLLQWTKRLSAQLRRSRALLEVRSIRRADDRILAYLDLLSVLGETWDGRRPNSAVATELGLTPEALYRSLARLERSQAVRRQGRTVARNS